MERTFALINGGVVTNTAVWDGVTPWDHGAEHLVEITGTDFGVGDLFDGDSLSHP